MNSVARHLRIAATVKLLELDAIAAAARGFQASPLPREGGAERACPAPPLPSEHARLRKILLAMLGVRGAA